MSKIHTGQVAEQTVYRSDDFSLRGKFPKLNAGFWPHRQSQVAAATCPLGVGTAPGVLMGCSRPKVLRRRETG